MTVLAAVERDLAAIDSKSPVFASLRELALTIAEAVDECESDKDLPQLARQLRETLAALAALAGGASDDRLARLQASLSAPVRDTSNSAPKSRPRRSGGR